MSINWDNLFMAAGLISIYGFLFYLASHDKESPNE